MSIGSDEENAFETENIGLRELLAQAGVDAARLLAQAGIDASQNEAAKQLQRLLLEELHHRVKNTLATVIAITSQSLRNAETLEQGRFAVENRLMALGRAHDLLLQASWTSAQLSNVIRTAVEPFDDLQISRFSVQELALDIT
ncbi:MAG TPA: HWE histidine kinase domain-containing protein, partial [Candidatus Binatia bacterium]|nr:HWE histidine kinase domain-containing protein [Candidatus Binatia bacterium]